MKPSVLVIATLSALLSACGGGEDNAPLAIPDYRVDVALPTAGTLCADLDQNWLDDAGRITWELFRAYRGFGA